MCSACPGSSIIFDSKGLIRRDRGQQQSRPIEAGDHPDGIWGAIVELSTGLSANDKVIQNPPDGVGTGETVNVITEPAAGAAAAAASSPKGKNDHG
jgi:hypothetical protein